MGGFSCQCPLHGARSLSCIYVYAVLHVSSSGFAWCRLGTRDHAQLVEPVLRRWMRLLQIHTGKMAENSFLGRDVDIVELAGKPSLHPWLPAGLCSLT